MGSGLRLAVVSPPPDVSVPATNATTGPPPLSRDGTATRDQVVAEPRRDNESASTMPLGNNGRRSTFQVPGPVDVAASAGSAASGRSFQVMLDSVHDELVRWKRSVEPSPSTTLSCRSRLSMAWP